MSRSRRADAMLVSLLLSSCAGPSPVVSGPSSGPSAVAPSEAPSRPVAPPPPSSAPAPAVSALPPPPKPATPSGIDQERFALLSDLCAISVWAGPKGPMFGCRSGPPFDKPDTKPDGTVRQAAEFSDVCFLDEVYRGSFTGAGRDQAIVGLEACGSERANDITPGNVVLAERGPTGWSVMAVQRDTNVRKCAVSKRKERTLLVCGDNMGAFGDGSLAWRFTLDFSAPEQQRVKVFSKIYASSATSCMMGTGILGERGVTTIDVSNERFVDTDADGVEDLAFTVERAHTAPSVALGARAEAQCKGAKDGKMVDLTKLSGPKKRHTLQFRGGPSGLVATEATKKLLDAWGLESPEFWWNIVKSAP